MLSLRVESNDDGYEHGSPEFLSRWPSSAKSNPISVWPSSSISNRSFSYETIITSRCITSVSPLYYEPRNNGVPGVTTFFPFETHHCRTIGTKSPAAVLPSIASGDTAPSPNHLTNSLAQFRTREDGQTTMTLSIAPFPARGDCLSSVQSRVMHWS